jgi:hypothetical protein
MNRKEAVKIYLEHNNLANKTIDRIQKFDGRQSSTKFAEACGVGLGYAYGLARSYNLKFTGRAKSNRETILETQREEKASKWDKEKTVLENAQALGIHYATALGICKKYKLQSRLKYTSLATLKKMERIKEFRKKGLSDSEISRVLAVSREYIRQLNVLMA